MAKEIERKFLVTADGAWRDAPATRLRQAYLVAERGMTIRVRIAGERAFLTIKSATSGMARDEFEYPIPVADAAEMLDKLRVGAVIDKTRHRIEVADHVWEVDEFHGDNDGLIVAEVELRDHREEVRLPSWVGREVTGQSEYYNASLARRPYRSWRDDAAG